MKGSQIDDCDQPWTFDPESIDFVHIRYMTGSVQNWDALFDQAFQSIKPGGYLESFESTGYFVSDDGTVKEDSALAQWGKFFYEGGKKMGRNFRVVDQGVQRAELERAGFVDIEERDFKVCVVAFSVRSHPRNSHRYRYPLESGRKTLG